MRKRPDPDKTPPAELVEFPDDPTPPGAIITDREVMIVRRGVRVAVKGFMPFVPKIAASAGPALAVLLLAAAQHWAGRAETDKKIQDVAGESEKTTARAYKKLAKPAREISAELADAMKRIDALEATSKAQSALIVAREHDIVIEGRPAKAPRRRVDPGLVKAVQANAVKDSKELAARKAKPAPAITPIPLELPPAPTKPADMPATQQAPVLIPVRPPAQDAAK